MTLNESILLAISGVAMALGEIFEDTVGTTRWKPLVVLLAGIVVAFIFVPPPFQWQQVLQAGILSGLAGSGLIGIGKVVRPQNQGNTPPPPGGNQPV